MNAQTRLTEPQGKLEKWICLYKAQTDSLCYKNAACNNGAGGYTEKHIKHKPT